MTELSEVVQFDLMTLIFGKEITILSSSLRVLEFSSKVIDFIESVSAITSSLLKSVNVRAELAATMVSFPSPPIIVT